MANASLTQGYRYVPSVSSVSVANSYTKTFSAELACKFLHDHSIVFLVSETHGGRQVYVSLTGESRNRVAYAEQKKSSVKISTEDGVLLLAKSIYYGSLPLDAFLETSGLPKSRSSRDKHRKCVQLYEDAQRFLGPAKTTEFLSVLTQSDKENIL